MKWRNDLTPWRLTLISDHDCEAEKKSREIDMIKSLEPIRDMYGNLRKEEFACPYCEIVFDSKNEFTEHVALHVEGYPCQTGGRNVKCLIPKCDVLFWTDGDMKQHLTKTHKMTKKL